MEELTNKSEFSQFFLIGTVLSSNEKTREIVCYVPKLLAGLPGSSLTVSSISTNYSSNKITGFTDISNSIKVQNGITFKAWDINAKLPAVGSKVSVFFLEGNPKNAFWFPGYNSNDDFIPIENEKYDEYYSLSVNEKKITVKKDDLIQFVIDDSDSILFEDEKTKTFSIKPRKNLFISSTIPENIKKGNLWFNTSNSILYLYQDSENIYRVSTEKDIKQIYDFLQNLARIAKEIDFLAYDSITKTDSLTKEENQDKFLRENEINVGDVLTSSAVPIIFREDDDISKSGYLYSSDMNLMLLNGIETSGFRRAIIKNGLLALEDINGLTNWDGNFSIDGTGVISFSNKIRLNSVTIKGLEESTTEEKIKYNLKFFNEDNESFNVFGNNFLYFYLNDGNIYGCSLNSSITKIKNETGLTLSFSLEDSEYSRLENENGDLININLNNIVSEYSMGSYTLNETGTILTFNLNILATKFLLVKTTEEGLTEGIDSNIIINHDDVIFTGKKQFSSEDFKKIDFEDLETRLEKLENYQDSSSSEIEDLETRLEKLENYQNSSSSEIEDLKTSITEINNRLDLIESEFIFATEEDIAALFN